MNKELKNLAVWTTSFVSFIGMVGAADLLSGCTWDQATPYVAAGCAAGEIAAATAQVNAAALNKQTVASEIALAQQLATTDCTAALQAIAAAKAASTGAAPPLPTTK